LTTSILVADDHAIVRAGLRALIQSEPSLSIVAEAAGGVEAMSLTKQFKPDVLLLDLSMPDMDGITVTKELHIQYPELRILILTVHEDEGLLREAIRSGASGYILKHAAEKELIEAIKRVMKGEMYVDPKMLPSLFEQKKTSTHLQEEKIKPLTPREVEVLKLIADGYTNRQIGEQLNLSVRTVEGHRANIFAKLGLHNRVELVRYAKEHHLIE